MQPFTPIKLTTPQLWLVHTLETVALGAVVTGAITAYGAVSTGNYDWKVVGGLVLAAVLAVLTKGWSTSIQGNANLAPAIHDYLGNILAIVSRPQPAAIAPQGPPVVVNVTHPAIVEPPAPQAAVRSLNAFPVPARPTGPAPIQMLATPQPVADIAALNTAQVPVPPSLPDMPQRNWNNSGLIQAVQPAGQ
jgi:hypothetical protein